MEKSPEQLSTEIKNKVTELNELLEMTKSSNLLVQCSLFEDDQKLHYVKCYIEV